MLVLSRRVGERIFIELAGDSDPALPAADLFEHGPLEIRVTQIQGSQVKIGLVVDGRLRILRSELRGREPGP